MMGDVRVGDVVRQPDGHLTVASRVGQQDRPQGAVERVTRLPDWEAWGCVPLTTIELFRACGEEIPADMDLYLDTEYFEWWRSRGGLRGHPYRRDGWRKTKDWPPMGALNVSRMPPADLWDYLPDSITDKIDSEYISQTVEPVPSTKGTKT